MYILNETKKKISEEEYDIPPDVKVTVGYKELMFLIDKQALSKGYPLFSYKSGGEAMKIIACPLKGIFEFPNSGINIEIPPKTDFFIPAGGMKQCTYYEHHGINGGKPLSYVEINISLKDNGHVKFSYQIVGYWPENDGFRKKILGIK